MTTAIKFVPFISPVTMRGEQSIKDSPVRSILQHTKRNYPSEFKKLVFHLENTPLGFIEWDSELRIRSLSKRAEEIFGWTLKEFVENEKSGYSQVYEDDRAKVFKIARQLLSGKVKKNNIQHRNYTRDGRIIWCDWFNSVLKDKNGKVVSVMSMVQDITAQKKAQQKLKHSESKLKDSQKGLKDALSFNEKLIEASSIGIGSYDAISGKCISANPAFIKIIGASHKEILRQNFRNIKSWSTSCMLTEAEDTLLTGKATHNQQHCITSFHKNIWIDYTFIKFLNKNQPHLLLMMNDITERKKAEDALSQSESRYRQIVETAQEGIWMIDENNKTNFVNKKMCEIFKYPEEEMIGKDIFYFMQDNWKEEGFKAMERRKKGINEDLDFSFVTKTGKPIWVNLSSNPILDPEGKYCGALAMVSDVTEKKLLQQKLLQHKVQQLKNITKAVVGAQEKERAEIGAELHDNVNQLLAASKLYIGHGLTQADYAPSILQGMEYLNTAMEEVRKLSHALVGPSQNENIGLIKSVEELAENISMVTDIKIRFDHCCFNEEEYEGGLKIIIYRIIQEQTNNILKYAAATEVIIELRKELSDLLLHINDNGKGFDTTRIRHGIGLKNISNRACIYNGTVNILSSPGNGCKMKIVFKPGYNGNI